MNHIVLLGDSIFDNAAYVNAGPDVIRQLKSILPRDWQASLLAVDGSVTTEVITQIHKIPAAATHLIVSAGGNDGLSRADTCAAG
jgi:pentose-5-phosphate-3-epimerase